MLLPEICGNVCKSCDQLQASMIDDKLHAGQMLRSNHNKMESTIIKRYGNRIASFRFDKM